MADGPGRSGAQPEGDRGIYHTKYHHEKEDGAPSAIKAVLPQAESLESC